MMCSRHNINLKTFQMTVRSTSGNSEKPLGVCRQCHKTCLVTNNNNSSQQFLNKQQHENNQQLNDEITHQHSRLQQELHILQQVQQAQRYEEPIGKPYELPCEKESTTETDVNANPTSEFIDDNWGPLSFLTSVLSPYDPFSPVPVPHISVLPPSPPTTIKSPTSNNNFWDDAELSNATDTATPVVSIFQYYF